jgi:hypothetical protein
MRDFSDILLVLQFPFCLVSGRIMPGGEKHEQYGVFLLG